MIACDDRDLFPNFVALWVAIVHGFSDAEAAFRLTDRLLDKPFSKAPPLKPPLTDQDTEEMVRLKREGMSYKAIGERYDFTISGVYYRISEYEKKQNERSQNHDHKPTH